MTRKPITPDPRHGWTRRDALTAGASAAALAAVGLAPWPAMATPREARDKLAELTGGAQQIAERVTVEIPEYTTRGPFVPLTVAVESPMTDADHVKAIHVVAERNTVPLIASYFLSPANGRAEIRTRIRLAQSQIIHVAAVMSDGKVYVGRARSTVSKGGGGCG